MNRSPSDIGMVETSPAYTAVEISTHNGHDPDAMNDDRVYWGSRLIDIIKADTNTDEEDALCDALANLMHWASDKGYDFRAGLERACGHFEAETAMKE